MPASAGTALDLQDVWTLTGVGTAITVPTQPGPDVGPYRWGSASQALAHPTEQKWNVAVVLSGGGGYGRDRSASRRSVT